MAVTPYQWRKHKKRNWMCKDADAKVDGKPKMDRMQNGTIQEMAGVGGLRKANGRWLHCDEERGKSLCKETLDLQVHGRRPRGRSKRQWRGCTGKDMRDKDILKGTQVPGTSRSRKFRLTEPKLRKSEKKRKHNFANAKFEGFPVLNSLNSLYYWS